MQGHATLRLPYDGLDAISLGFALQSGYQTDSKAHSVSRSEAVESRADAIV
jgi:hypothetical protein